MVTNRLFILIISAAFFNLADAAPRDAGGNAKIVSKLQAMVNDITSERDRLKAENAKIAAELEGLKGQVIQEKTAAASLEERLNAEISSQKASSGEKQARLDSTLEKLREVVEKYNALNKAKNDLAAEHTGLQNAMQMTASELKVCESKNTKMYEGAKEIIDGLHNCKNRGVVDALIGSEPFLQFNNVEFETIVQEYEDKLNKQKYQAQPKAAPTKPANSETTDQSAEIRE